MRAIGRPTDTSVAGPDWPSQYAGPEPGRTERPTWLAAGSLRSSAAEERAETGRLRAAERAAPPDWPRRPAVPTWNPTRWLVDAACQTADDEVSGRLVAAEQPSDLTADLASLCAACPVRRQCLAAGVGAHSTGVYGGRVLLDGWPAQARPVPDVAGVLHAVRAAPGGVVADLRALGGFRGHNAALVELLAAGLVREDGLSILLVDAEADEVGQRVLTGLRRTATGTSGFWGLRRQHLRELPTAVVQRAVSRLIALGHVLDDGRKQTERTLTLTAEAPVPADVEQVCERVRALLDRAGGSLSEERLRELVNDADRFRQACTALVLRGQAHRERIDGTPHVRLPGVVLLAEELVGIVDPQEQLVVRLRGLLRRRGELRLSDLRGATRLDDDAVERAVAVLVERGEVVVERHGRGYHARLAAA